MININPLPLISVLIPAYNVELFVEEALKSILDQTYSNLEIIVVDDCSTDGTYQLLLKLKAEDDRIKLFRNDKNSKIVATLNLALSKANGTYIVRMDADDISLCDRIEKQYLFLQDNPQIDLVGTSATFINQQGVIVHNEDYLKQHEDLVVASNYISPVLHIWMCKKSLYDEVGIYRIPSAEDLDFLLRCLDSGKKIANIPEYLYKVRFREGNTATSTGLTQRKSIEFARRLHKERMMKRQRSDSFSDILLEKAIAASYLETVTYRIASKYHFAYLRHKSKSKVRALIYRLLAVLFSPKHQLREIWSRRKYKKMLTVKTREK